MPVKPKKPQSTKGSKFVAPGRDASLTQVGGTDLDKDRRIRDCAQARELYDRLYLENVRRAEIYAQVRNQIEGGRPFDPEILQRNGEEWRTNVNFRDAEAAFFRAVGPYWKMVNEVPRKISVKIHESSPDAEKWELAIAEAFDRFIDDWGPDWYSQFQGYVRDFVKFGPGYMMWPDEETPRSKWCQTVQMYFPKRTKSNVDEWELVAMKREMTASQLWDKVKTAGDLSASVDQGWNAAMVEQAIELAAPTPTQNKYFDPNYYQDLVINNDLVIGGVWPPVTVIDVWAKEKEGKIRHYILTEKSDVPDYLYSSYEDAESFRQIFAPVFYDVGENGLIHSIKGFGVKNYYYATVIDRTKCRIIDAATFSLGMNFSRDDNTPDESPPVENYSMVNIFPKGLNQLQYVPQFGSAQQVVQILKANQDENNYQYNETRSDIANTDTAKQAEILASIGQEMSTAQSSTFLSQIGTNLFSEMIRRLRKPGSEDKDAVKFRERVKKLGVPDKIISKAELTIKTGASPTMASPMVRAQIANQLMQVVYPKPDANRRWIDEFFVANLLGSDGVNRALLPVGMNSDPRARREAMMENVDLAQGVPLPADPSDAHVEHLDEHLKPLEAIVQAAKHGQMPTADHLMALQIGLVHSQQHLDMLATDETRKPDYRALKARFTNVQSVAQGIMARLARMQQQAQQTGQPINPQAMETASQGPQA